MNRESNSIFKRYTLATYFVLAFTFTWLILSPGVAANLGLWDFGFDGTILTILGVIGPLLAGSSQSISDHCYRLSTIPDIVGVVHRAKDSAS